jgi:hypothetical protein
MQRRLTINVPWAIAALALALAGTMLWLTFPPVGHSLIRSAKNRAQLYRLAANTWGEEISTDQEEAQIFYDRTLPVNVSDFRVLFITLTATSDQHDGAKLQLSCWVDGNNCDTYGNPVNVAFENADLHDNSITQTWCVAVTGPPSQKEIQLGLSSSNGGDVFMEHGAIYVDAAGLAAACGSDGITFIGGEKKN